MEVLKPSEIYFLEEHLNKIETELPNYITSDNEEDLTEIIEETIELRTQLGAQTREWVAKGLSSILAKITKNGPEIFKGIFKEFGKQLMTQGVKFLIEHGDKLIS